MNLISNDLFSSVFIKVYKKEGRKREREMEIKDFVNIYLGQSVGSIIFKSQFSSFSVKIPKKKKEKMK